mgnify:FL=1
MQQRSGRSQRFLRFDMQLLTRVIKQARWLKFGKLPVPVCEGLPAKGRRGR